MIGFLKGNLISAKPTQLLIDVNGVGYLCNISITTFEKISDQKSVSLFIHTHVKEDSITLFGFHSESEKIMFELLISVSGVGPKIALGILSGIQIDDLKNAILQADISRISAVPGIGRKTAERLILELKNKVDQVRGDSEVEIPFSIKNEAVMALSTLGYNNKLAEKVVWDILTTEPKVALEELIKKALSSLNK
ncbi:MAG: Holliday junction branch migration protein RuvA [Ignavibacteriaceae bacterium]|nr:Holliday junction branch migration protein RuvA [Ignavibacteriaceae bacterium]